MLRLFYVILASVFVWASFSCGGKEAEQEEASAHFQKGIIFEEENKFDSAAVCYLSAIGSLNPNKPSNFEALGSYYNRIALLLFKSELNDEAEKMFREAIVFNSRLLDKGPLSESYRGLWKCFCVDNTESLDTTVLKTVELIPYIQDKEELYKTKNALAYYFLISGDYHSAMKYSAEIESLFPDSVSFYKNCLVKGSIFYAEGNIDSAIAYTKKAICSSYIYTRVSAYENMYAMTGDSAYYDLFRTLNDSISGMMKPAKVNSAFYGKLINNMNAEYSRKIHDRTLFSIFGTAIIVVLIGVFLFFFFRKRAKQSHLTDTDGLPRAHSVEMEKKGESLQREIVDQIKEITTIKNKRFKKSAIFKQTLEHIDGGAVFLPISLRNTLFESLKAEYALLYQLLTTYFSFSDEEFYFFCLSSLGLNTKESAACRSVSLSAIRVLRKRVNDKMRKYITTEALFESIKL